MQNPALATQKQYQTAASTRPPNSQRGRWWCLDSEPAPRWCGNLGGLLTSMPSWDLFCLFVTKLEETKNIWRTLDTHKQKGTNSMFIYKLLAAASYAELPFYNIHSSCRVCGSLSFLGWHTLSPKHATKLCAFMYLTRKTFTTRTSRTSRQKRKSEAPVMSWRRACRVLWNISTWLDDLFFEGDLEWLWRGRQEFLFKAFCFCNIAAVLYILMMLYYYRSQ